MSAIRNKLLAMVFLLGTSILVSATNPLVHLGTPSLEAFDFSYDVDIKGDEDDCDYTLTVRFSHLESLPSGGPDTCQVDVIASDGLPYFANRWHYARLDEATRLATGFDHISLDWNACGHPGFGFQTPHYDFHFYTVTPEFRAAQMQCDKIHGTPVCKEPDAQEGTGRGYYVYGRVQDTRQLDNLPAGYDWDPTSAVEYMGIHAGNAARDPDHPVNWTQPLLYFTNFNGAICSVEPMFPFSYSGGDKDQFQEESIEYEFLTLATLPNYYSLGYDAQKRVTTTVMKGKSALCQADFNELRGTETQDIDPPSSALKPSVWLGSSLLVSLSIVFCIAF